MREMLGEEFPAFEACMKERPLRGIRLNSLKFDPKEPERLGLPLRKCPFSVDGYYLGTDETGIGNSPWHHAGAF